MDSFVNETNKGCGVILTLVVVLCLGIAIGDYHHKKNNNIIDNTDVAKHNDSLKIQVNNLDSAKDAKVIEVEALDNDSTVKLFYQLIK